MRLRRRSPAASPPPDERYWSRWADRAWRAFIGIALVGSAALLWLVEVSGRFQLGVNLFVCYLLGWALAFAVGTTPRREIRARFALMTIALGLLLVTLEAVAFLGPLDFRLLFRAPLTGHRRNPINRFDEELLHLRRPHLAVTGTRTRGNLGTIWCLPPSPPSPLSARYDSTGFRNESDLASADIGVIGDSYIEAMDVPTAEVMTSVLAQLTGMTVANLGQSGYSARRELIVLKRYALPLRPKVIVWAFYEGNDLSEIDIYDSIIASGGARAMFRASLLDRSFSKNALGALYGLLWHCQPNPVAQRRFGVVTDTDGRRVRLYFGDPGNAIGPISLHDATALEKLLGILSEAHALTRARGIQLVIAYIPDPFRVYRTVAEFPPDSECLGWKVNDLPQRLRQLVGEVSADVGFLDLTPALIAEARVGQILYWPDDTHWTPAGHRVAAQTLSEFVRNRLAAEARR